jgi:hypothetical protein
VQVQGPARRHLLAHTLQVDVIVELGDESRQVELELRRVSLEVPLVEMGLVLQKQIVHRPELALGRRRFRGFRGRERVRVRNFLREMPKDQANIAFVPGQHQLYCRCRLAAARAFKVPVLDDGDASITRSPEVIRAINIEQR